MTNGEMIQRVYCCEVCEPIPEDDIIHVIFSDKNNSAIGFDWSWWNMEYKEQTTKIFADDCISRADAIKAMQDKAKKLTNEDTINGLCGAVAILFDMPSVTPQEPKTGYWMKSNIGGAKVCSVCNAHMGLSSFKFCPNCGARMVDPQESEE